MAVTEGENQIVESLHQIEYCLGFILGVLVVIMFQGC